MANLKANYRVLLQDEYEKRAEVNSRFSQNSFANYLDVTPSYYSKLMNGKILLSLEVGDKITKKLNLNDEQRKKFLLSIADEQRCHALYLIDPSLTNCEPDLEATNKYPVKRK